jgi:hypothetical protein
MKTKIIGAAALVAVVSVVAACGGSDEGGSSDGGAELTKEEYIAAADAICEEANAAQDELGEPTTEAEFLELVPQNIAIAEDQMDKLEALVPPAADAETLNGAFKLLRQQIDLIQQYVDAIEAGDTATADDLSGQIDAIQAEADQVAIDYGMKVCGAE